MMIGRLLYCDGWYREDFDAERSRGKLMNTLIVSSKSVFSEAFLFLGRVRPQGGRAPFRSVDLTALRWSLFWIFDRANCLDEVL